MMAFCCEPNTAYRSIDNRDDGDNQFCIILSPSTIGSIFDRTHRPNDEPQSHASWQITSSPKKRRFPKVKYSITNYWVTSTSNLLRQQTHDTLHAFEYHFNWAGGMLSIFGWCVAGARGDRRALTWQKLNVCRKVSKRIETKTEATHWEDNQTRQSMTW